LRPESSQEHLPTRIAGVLRLRAIKFSVCDKSARRFAQDDGFVGGLKGLEIQLVGHAENTKRSKKSQALRMTALSGGLKYNGWIRRKRKKIEKVTGSRDDKGKGNGSIKMVAEPRRFSNLIWTGLKFSRPFGTNLKG
jgi:hypothetical protein